MMEVSVMSAMRGGEPVLIKEAIAFVQANWLYFHALADCSAMEMFGRDCLNRK